MSAEELYRATFTDELMLIKPFMPAGGHCLLHGKRGLGKTQLAHTIALSVALGQPFLGEYEVAQDRVFYVQADMTQQLQQDRLRRIIDAGVPATLPLRYMIFPGSFDCEAEAAAEAAWVDDLRSYDPGLVIVDTLRKSHAREENASDSAVHVYSAWRHICGPRPTILYLHHDRKTSELPREDNSEEFRGSGAWLDEADLGMHLRKGKAGPFLDWSKLRTCAEEAVKVTPLQIDADTLLMNPVDPVRSAVLAACASGAPKAQVVGLAMDKKRWGAAAWSQATAYRNLQGYAPTAKI